MSNESGSERKIKEAVDAAAADFLSLLMEAGVEGMAGYYKVLGIAWMFIRANGLRDEFAEQVLLCFKGQPVPEKEVE